MSVSESAVGEIGAARHLDLFRYLTSSDSAAYIAVMDAFGSSLSTELSAATISERLTGEGTVLDGDAVEDLCAQLTEWGNLVPSTSEARVDTVAEYLQARSRYRPTSLGGRVHRDAVSVMQAGDGARDVAREVLGQISDALTRISEFVSVPPGERDRDTVAGLVTSVFTHHRLFTAGATDFYAYLAGVLTTTDLGGAEYAEFKSLLLDYVDLMTADVNRHSPTIHATLTALDADAVLDVLAGEPGLRPKDSARGAGRTREEWDALRAWYAPHGDASGPSQLRAAAGRALGQLLTGAKRMLDGAHTGYSRRADLLRLASWFDDASDAEAERIFAATFGAHPTRHRVLGPDEPDPRVGSGTSWWAADPITVPVSLRDRGDRVSRGRVSRVPDPTADRQRLGDIVRAENRRTRDATRELLAVGALDGARLSPTARTVVLDQLARLLAAQEDPTGDGEWVDSDLGLRLRARRGGDTSMTSSDGAMIVHGLVLTVEAAASTHDRSAHAIGDLEKTAHRRAR